MKLVRDGVPATLMSNGQAPSTHIADDAEYMEMLKKKLIEVALLFEKDDTVENIAEIMELIKAISDHKQITYDQIKMARMTIKERIGGYQGRTILD